MKLNAEADKTQLLALERFADNVRVISHWCSQLQKQSRHREIIELLQGRDAILAKSPALKEMLETSVAAASAQAEAQARAPSDRAPSGRCRGGRASSFAPVQSNRLHCNDSDKTRHVPPEPPISAVRPHAPPARRGRATRAHAVITGASGGIGAALAAGLAARGTHLTLIGRNAERLQETAARCGGAVGVRQLTCDVTDAERMRAGLLAADDASPIDLVIANAGIGGRGVLAPPDGEPPALVREIFDVNMLGVVNTVSPLIERLRARRNGQVVLVSSLAGYAGLPDAPAYCASKAAVRVYGQGLRRLLAADGVGVTVVSPGFVDTAMSRSLPHDQPFRCSAEEAASRILRAADRGAHELAFPWQLVWLSRALSVLPPAVADLVLAVHRKRSGDR